jgi:selenocysteine lyase/cysteine desulfurase
VAHPDFPAAAGYLNTASMGLPPAPAVEAMRAAVEDWAAGRALAPDYDEPVGRARAAWARLHETDPALVAIGPQVSYFAGLVAQSLPAGAEVVSYEQDFASLVYPLLARDDLTVRLVPLEDVADAVTSDTALVAVSAVQSLDGRVADLPAIAAAAAAHDALTLVDSTQASGWLPIDATDFDYLVCAAYKWLLSPRGTAFLAARDADRLAALPPWAAGWYSADRPWEMVYGGPLRLAGDARRLDMSPAWLDWVATAAALEYIEGVGVDAIHAHDVRLANALRARLRMPPGDSAVVAVPGEDVVPTLVGAGLRVGGLAGGARVCLHVYNDEADVEAVLSALG